MGSIFSAQFGSYQQQTVVASDQQVPSKLKINNNEDGNNVPEKPLSHSELMERAMAVYSIECNLEATVVTTYGRAMIIGPSAVGKTSLKHGLMNRTLPPPESTRLAETRQVKYEWARAMGGVMSHWETVTDDHEYDELARLLSQVHKLPLNPTRDSAIAAFLSKPLVPTYFMSPFLPQASRVHKHKTKMLEVKGVVEAVKEEQFQKILNNAIALWDVKNPSDLMLSPKKSSVDPEVLMHVWDCGGQAIYLEILPAFLTSRTMFILAFNASEELEANWRDVLNTEGRREEREQQNYSTIDLLVRWLATIHAHLARYDKHHTLGGYPRVLMIGTHGDKLKAKSVDYTKKIKEALNQRCQDKAFSELILGVKVVDNTTAGKMENEDPVFQEIRDEVYKFASQQLTHDTPISWVLFRKLLHQYRRELNKPILTLSEATAVGIACRIQEADIPVVLNFYHELGVVLYYGYIPSLQDTVICDPQWLIRQFAKIFSLDVQENIKNSSQWKLLQTQGILTSSLYEAVWQDSFPEPQALVDLMEHFLLAAPIVCNTTRDLYQPEIVKEYFVPLMLSVYNPDTQPQPDTEYYQTATPLYLLFNTGYVVTGFFIRLTAVLAKNDHFKILFRRGVYRNRIILEYGPPSVTRVDEVIITEHLDKVEVTVARCVPAKHKRCFREVCRNVLESILQSSEEVLQWLPSIHIDPAFLCQCSILELSESAESSDVSFSSDAELPSHGSAHVKCHSSSSKDSATHYVTFTRDRSDDDYLRCDQFHFIHPTHEQKYWLKPTEGKHDECFAPPPIGNIKLREIADQIGDCLPILAKRLRMENELELILRDPGVTHTAYSFLRKWNSLSGNVESLSDSLRELGFTELGNEIKPPSRFSMTTERALMPVSSEPLRGPEVLYISNNIDSRKMEALAARLDMLEMYHDIVRDVTVQNKKLFFLNKWCHMMDNRAALSLAVYDIGLTKLSERIRCGGFIDKTTGEFDRSLLSPTVQSSRKSSQQECTTTYQSTTPSLADITDCSRYLSGGDLLLLAYAVDIGDEEYEELQRKYKHPSGLGLHLLKKWRRDVQGTKEELRQLLVSVECLSAAERYAR